MVSEEHVRVEPWPLGVVEQIIISSDRLVEAVGAFLPGL